MTSETVDILMVLLGVGSILAAYFLFREGKSKDGVIAVMGAIIAGLWVFGRRRSEIDTEPMERPHVDPEPIADEALKVIAEEVAEEVGRIEAAVTGDDPAGDIADLANAARRTSDSGEE